jgi:hypothetical protein
MERNRKPTYSTRAIPMGGLNLLCAKGGRRLKRLFGKQEPHKDPRDEATRKFYELAGLYTMSFHRNEGKPDWFYDRIEELGREPGEETAKAALDYASDHESFYHRLMY